MLNFWLKRTIEWIQTGSILTGISSTISAWARIQDTEFIFENIWRLTLDWTIEWFENLRNFICKSVNEIVNLTDYLKEEYDIPFPEYKDQAIIDIENIKLDTQQLLENIDIINDFSPEKLENFFTILVSMWIISWVFIYLIPKILQKVKVKIT